jgi:hypothetical protein
MVWEGSQHVAATPQEFPLQAFWLVSRNILFVETCLDFVLNFFSNAINSSELTVFFSFFQLWLMALFSDLGSYCYFSECKTQDFLPFKCEHCMEDFCLSHRTPDSHGCKSRSASAATIICPMCHVALRIDPRHDSKTIHIDHSATCQKSPLVIARCPVMVYKNLNFIW